MSPELADQSYAMLVNPKGFTPAAKLDLEGVRKVLELRSEYGRPKKERLNRWLGVRRQEQTPDHLSDFFWR